MDVFKRHYSSSRRGRVLLSFGPLLMILFRQKYPRWWFDWNLEIIEFSLSSDYEKTTAALTA